VDGFRILRGTINNRIVFASLLGRWPGRSPACQQTQLSAPPQPRASASLPGSRTRREPPPGRVPVAARCAATHSG